MRSAVAVTVRIATLEKRNNDWRRPGRFKEEHAEEMDGKFQGVLKEKRIEIGDKAAELYIS